MQESGRYNAVIAIVDDDPSVRRGLQRPPVAAQPMKASSLWGLYLSAEIFTKPPGGEGSPRTECGYRHAPSASISFGSDAILESPCLFGFGTG